MKPPKIEIQRFPTSVLNAIADAVLAHKPKPKSAPARKRARRAKKIAQAAVTTAERATLDALVAALRSRARRVGSMSALWDVIFDIEAFLKNEPTVVSMTAQEWIRYANERLE